MFGGAGNEVVKRAANESALNESKWGKRDSD